MLLIRNNILTVSKEKKKCSIFFAQSNVNLFLVQAYSTLALLFLTQKREGKRVAPISRVRLKRHSISSLISLYLYFHSRPVVAWFMSYETSVLTSCLSAYASGCPPRALVLISEWLLYHLRYWAVPLKMSPFHPLTWGSSWDDAYRGTITDKVTILPPKSSHFNYQMIFFFLLAPDHDRWSPWRLRILFLNQQAWYYSSGSTTSCTFVEVWTTLLPPWCRAMKLKHEINRNI